MGKNKPRKALDVGRKERNKAVKSAVQFVVLAMVLVLLVHAVAGIHRYREPDKAAWQQTRGFIALSYYGVDRTGTRGLIAKSRLDEQLQILRQNGYVTVSQQDILDFYEHGKPLPQRAVYLSFEDGRSDSALFAQPLLEKYNYIATMLSYADRLDVADPKFLAGPELLKLTRKGYWELGSNGYRLTYINIFDKDGRYVGTQTEQQFKNKDEARYYTHYLMDFIRDADKVPLENRREMETRINQDYRLMEQIYRDKLGFVPNVYMIMHANSLHNGMNPLVENVNSQNIERLFKMHFNREGQAFNDSGGDLYDLTRLQPSPGWYRNHLLMRIAGDTGESYDFYQGDKKRADHWQLLGGAAEFRGNRIILTSPESGKGLLYLKGSDGYQNVKVSLQIAGNIIGSQSVYLRYDRKADAYVKVVVEDNLLRVVQKEPGQTEEKTLISRDLGSLKGVSEQTAIGRKLEVAVAGSGLTLQVDGAAAAPEIQIASALAAGGLALEASASEEHSQDPVYDGVFDDVIVSEAGQSGTDEPPGKVLFSNGYTPLQKAVNGVKWTFDALVDWAVETF
ncbi:polysaccharide deacetylase [Paenibacillus macerans]|uniref:polysaccharide deacetylase n=1 Tax=Paenibacillus macerans TaxID=44252 RepID=UPI00243014C5|nr:polysaccharide deacetylase [Paenibacillus macerans]MBS5909162.1 polysaccharide deacetylase [Paenibacillus macerans]